jgi:hypothetical protein
MKTRPVHPILLSLPLVAAACAPSGPSPEPLDEASELDDALERDCASSAELLIPAEEQFSFCLDHGSSGELERALHWQSARWLAWLSANEYAHGRLLAPALDELGFGDAGDAQAWQQDFATLTGLKEKLAACPQEQDALCNDLEYAYAQQWTSMFKGEGTSRGISFLSGGTFRDDDDGTGEFQNGSTQAVFAVHRELPLAIVAFRGTQTCSGIDIFTDAAAKQIDYGAMGEVHRGFHGALVDSVDGLPLRDLILRRANQLPVGTKVWVTGHSLGAALATLAAAELATNQLAGIAPYELAGVQTFGSPRIGNREFAHKFDALMATNNVASIRFTYGTDLVANSPAPLTGVDVYKHVEREIWLRCVGDADIDADNRVATAYPCESPVADHDMKNYYDRLGELRFSMPGAFSACGP